MQEEWPLCFPTLFAWLSPTLPLHLGIQVMFIVRAMCPSGQLYLGHLHPRAEKSPAPINSLTFKLSVSVTSLYNDSINNYLIP